MASTPVSLDLHPAAATTSSHLQLSPELRVGVTLRSVLGPPVYKVAPSAPPVLLEDWHGRTGASDAKALQDAVLLVAALSYVLENARWLPTVVVLWALLRQRNH